MVKYIKKHKIISAVALIIIIFGGYSGYNKFKGNQVQTSYLTAAVAKGTLVTSVSSSGQISASDQVDITAKVSGDITKVAVAAGQEVKAGDLIAQIDAQDAYKTLRDAQTNLETAQLSLDKVKQAADPDSVFSAQNTVASAQNSLDKLKLSQPIDYQNAQKDLLTAQNNLTKAYSDAFTAISNSFLNLPNIITALNDILTSDAISASDNSLGQGQINTDVLFNTTYETDQLKIKSYQIIAENDYTAARKNYDISYDSFKSASVYSDTATIDSLLSETLATAKAMAQAIKSENNYLAAWSDARALRNSSIFSQVTTYKSNLTTYSSQVNSSFSSLSSAETTIQNDKDAVVSADNDLKTLAQNQPLDLIAAENSLKEKQAALADLLAGADPLDIRTQEISVQQKRNTLYDAQVALADYTIKAPFNGVIAAINVKVGDSASGVIATIVTKQQIAELSLNELDAAKIKLGQKIISTFDAVDGLELTGQVASLDTLGTVSQGVVTYGVKIVFDTQDDRVKSGMSINATIITDSKTDVLMVANSAVKIDSSGSSYVQILDENGQPKSQSVQIGLVSDTDTEIVSGLAEGDKVITQTVTSGGTASSQSGSAASANRTSSGFSGSAIRIPGLGR